MKKILISILLSSLFMLTACQNDKALEVVSLKLDKEISAFYDSSISDSTYFNLLRCINEYNGDIYASIYGEAQIVRMDKNMNLKSKIGRKGKGPTEIMAIEMFLIHNDTIYLGNSNTKSFVTYTAGGEFISPIVSSKNKYDMMNRFVIDEDKIYYSSVYHENGKTSLVCLNMHSGDSTRFGTIKEFSSPFKTYYQNQSNIHLYENKLISIPRNVRVINIYDKNTLKLIYTDDISEFEPVRNLHNYLIGIPEYSDARMFQKLFADSYLKDNLLYVMYPNWATFDYNDMTGTTDILVFDVTDGIEPVKHIIINEILVNMCISDDYLYAFPVTGGKLNRYQLN